MAAQHSIKKLRRARTLTGLSIALLFSSSLVFPVDAEAYLLGIDGGFFGNVGQMRNQHGDTAKVWLNGWGAYASPGINLGPWFKIGPYFEYHKELQKTSPSSVGSQDSSGHGHFLGGALALRTDPIYILLGYSFSGTYSLDNLTASGFTSEYSDPSAWHFYFGYYFSSGLSLDFSYLFAHYKQQNIGNTAFDIGGNKREWRDYRLGLSFHF